MLEDTFVLLDALEADAQDLKNDHPGVCLEIGYLTSIFFGRLPGEFTASFLDQALDVSVALLQGFLGHQYVRRLILSMGNERPFFKFIFVQI